MSRPRVFLSKYVNIKFCWKKFKILFQLSLRLSDKLGLLTLNSETINHPSFILTQK